ncbi:terminase [Rhodobacter phage RcZahn]|nr:terminase [Rhodobacter phage RcZahn]
MQLLQRMGVSGQHVWELGKLYANRRKNPLDMAARLTYLRRAIEFLRHKAQEDADYQERSGSPMYSHLPVDFRTFVESPHFLNKMGVLWPRVMEAGEELNSGRYVECVLTGGIGVAKSTLAIYTQAYQTYILSCMANPHEVFDLDPSSEILIVFQSVNKNVATDVDYRRLRDMMAGSPYFMESFPFQKDRESEMRFPRRIGIKPVAGHDQGAIGQNVIGGILDEVNFMQVVENSKQSTTGGTYDQATSNYNSIASRRQSRFMQLGSLPGMLCLVSSRNYPGQFTDKKEEEAKSNPRIYVYDKRLWDIRPERFCGQMFNVFIGDATRKPRVMAETEIVAPEDRRLVMAIPVEYQHQFNTDILNALREVAGVSTQAMHPFMVNTEAIAAAFGHHPSILSRDSCDFRSTRVQIYPKRFVNLDQPRFAHIDPSLSRDSTGLAVGHVPRFIEVDRGDVMEILPVVQMDFTLEIRPPKGGEIEYSDIRRLLYALRDAGLPILWVTSDTFQSSDNLQILNQQGFVVGNQSMDTTTDAYDVTKQVIYDGRLLCPDHYKAQRELATLELNPVTQKIDHPPSGSKDISDAIAGVVYGITRRREVWAKHGVSMRNAPRKKPAGSAEPIREMQLTYAQQLKADRSAQRLRERLAEEGM